MDVLEEINTFQTQLDDVARGVNRIRYLKQKINNSLGTLKAVGNIDDDLASNKKMFSPITARIQSQSGMRKKHMYTLDSERGRVDPWKQNKESIKKDQQNNFYSESKNARQKWNNSFIYPVKEKKVKLNYRHQNPKKLSTFYLNSLVKNIHSTQRQQFSLQEIKKINYDSVKRQRQEIRKKIDEQKENRSKEIQMKKEKVLLQHKMAKKKTQGFILQKLQDLRARKKQDKQMKSKYLAIQIKHQLQLQKKETQRLSKLEQSVFMKQNIKKILQSKISKISPLTTMVVTEHQEEPQQDFLEQRQHQDERQDFAEGEVKDQ